MSSIKTTRAAKATGVVSLTEWKRQPIAGKDFLSVLDLSHAELDRRARPGGGA